MTRYLQRLCRPRSGGSQSPRLMVLLTMMLLLGSLASPAMATVTPDSVAAKAATVDAQQPNNIVLPTPTPTQTILIPPVRLVTPAPTPPVLSRVTPTPTPPVLRLVTETPVTVEGEESDPETMVAAEETTPAEMTVNVAWCPNGTDVANEDSGHDLEPLCLEQGPAVSVALTSTSGPTQVFGDVTTFPGSAYFSPLSFDDWVLSFNTVHVGDSALFCEGYHSFGNTKPYAKYALASLQTTIDTLEDENITCWWFGELPTTVSIQLTKWNCPAGYDFAAEGYGNAVNACWDDVNPNVNFSVKNEGDAANPADDLEQGKSTDPNANDSVVFPGIPAGKTEISEQVPDGYALVAVYCQTNSGLAEPIALTSDDSIEITTVGGSQIRCDVFDTLGAAPMNSPMDESGTSLTIYKWDCPQGTDASSSDPNYYSAQCATEMPNIPFTITDGSSNSPISTTSDTNGRQIDGLVPDGDGNLTIVETIPNGYQQPAVFCQFLNDENPGQSIVVDGGVIFHVGDNTDSIQCFWYNIPILGGPGNVHIYKWECTTEPPADAEYQWFMTNCTAPLNGVTFILHTPNVDIQTDTGDNGEEGFAMMGGVEPGTYALEELPEPGYELVGLYCVYVQGDAAPPTLDFDAVPFTDGTADVTVHADETLRCHFYNLKVDAPNTIHVTKWACPDGYDTTGKTITDLQNDCTTRLEGVDFTVTNSDGSITQTTDINGEAMFEPLPAGEHALSEVFPSGYSPYPVVVCGGTVFFNGAIGDMFPQIVSAPGGIYTIDFGDGQYSIHCDYYNVPQDPSTVDIYKWACPEGVEPEPTVQWHQDNCVTPMDGVEFTLTDTIGPRSQTTIAGMVSFTDVSTGPIQIAETIPSGYSNQPFLVCQFAYPDGTGTGQYSPTPVNGVYNTTIDVPGSIFRCDWYNHPAGTGVITVYKWTCPEGYDRTAWGADPMVDCTEATDGITFKLIQPAPMPELQSDTGDSNPGAVYFDGLEPGTYILNELLSPEQAMGMKEVFVWQCYGLTTSSVQPYPLNVGQMFQFDVAGGDHIICHWFNVPLPQDGWMTVTKLDCTTETYVADVYCYTNQTGQEFNLEMWNGSTWTTIASGKTDVNGQLSFPDLDQGDYRLVEPNATACLVKSSNITAGKNIGVNHGQETTVRVYNCNTAPPPTKTPTKYPNTGVDPGGNSSSEQRTPGIEIAGLLGLAGMSLNRRRLLQRAAGLTLGAGALALPAVAAQDLVPLDSTPSPATPGANIFGCGTPIAEIIGPADSTPESSPAVDQCALGPIPIQFRAPIIGIDAAVEYLEIIDGQMQPPSGAEDVTWYKETTRLGQVGNGIYAGHLNYWGIPEGVFFRLESLKEGDIIEIDGDDAQTYIYRVQWTKNFPSDEEPPEEALGTTAERAITVITCGGEWVSERAEYDHRTLVRAVLLEDNA